MTAGTATNIWSIELEKGTETDTIRVNLVTDEGDGALKLPELLGAVRCDCRGWLRRSDGLRHRQRRAQASECWAKSRS